MATRSPLSLGSPIAMLWYCSLGLRPSTCTLQHCDSSVLRRQTWLLYIVVLSISSDTRCSSPDAPPGGIYSSYFWPASKHVSCPGASRLANRGFSGHCAALKKPSPPKTLLCRSLPVERQETRSAARPPQHQCHPCHMSVENGATPATDSCQWYTMNTHAEVKENPKTQIGHMCRPKNAQKVGAELSATRGTQTRGHIQTLPGTLPAATKQCASCNPHNRMQTLQTSTL